MKNTKKVLLLFDSPFVAPREYDFAEEFKTADWVTEKNVYRALLANGYEALCLGVHDNIAIVLDEIKENRPDVVFNLTEVFNEKSNFDKNIAWLVEVLGVPYTGASPSILGICNNKALTKKILAYHRIKVPKFHTFYKGRRVYRPKRLNTPLIVKPLGEEASRGISQASIVDSDDALVERVRFIHEKMDRDAIVEEYINGRELYIGVIGNKRTRVFPPIEMKFGSGLEDEARIATYKAKWDNDYRKKWGIKNILVNKLPEGMNEKIASICRRAYRVLNIRSYVRFDIRFTATGDVYIIEVNANPNLAKYEDFSLCAEKNGLPYNKLIKSIISLAFQR
ncbi:MAG: ATP-grasp domain-containing protein [Candidatus Omnitrophota bacterium]